MNKHLATIVNNQIYPGQDYSSVSTTSARKFYYSVDGNEYDPELHSFQNRAKVQQTIGDEFFVYTKVQAEFPANYPPMQQYTIGREKYVYVQSGSTFVNKYDYQGVLAYRVNFTTKAGWLRLGSDLVFPSPPAQPFDPASNPYSPYSWEPWRYANGDANFYYLNGSWFLVSEWSTQIIDGQILTLYPPSPYYVYVSDHYSEKPLVYWFTLSHYNSQPAYNISVYEYQSPNYRLYDPDKFTPILQHDADNLVCTLTAQNFNLQNNTLVVDENIGRRWYSGLVLTLMPEMYIGANNIGRQPTVFPTAKKLNTTNYNQQVSSTDTTRYNLCAAQTKQDDASLEVNGNCNLGYVNTKYHYQHYFYGATTKTGLISSFVVQKLSDTTFRLFPYSKYHEWTNYPPAEVFSPTYSERPQNISEYVLFSVGSGYTFKVYSNHKKFPDGTPVALVPRVGFYPDNAVTRWRGSEYDFQTSALLAPMFATWCNGQNIDIYNNAIRVQANSLANRLEQFSDYQTGAEVTVKIPLLANPANRGLYCHVKYAITDPIPPNGERIVDGRKISYRDTVLLLNPPLPRDKRLWYVYPSSWYQEYPSSNYWKDLTNSGKSVYVLVLYDQANNWKPSMYKATAPFDFSNSNFVFQWTRVPLTANEFDVYFNSNYNENYGGNFYSIFSTSVYHATTETDFRLPAPLVQNRKYYLIKSGDMIRFAATYADAVADNAIQLTDTGFGMMCVYNDNYHAASYPSQLLPEKKYYLINHGPLNVQIAETYAKAIAREPIDLVLDQNESYTLEVQEEKNFRSKFSDFHPDINTHAWNPASNSVGNCLYKRDVPRILSGGFYFSYYNSAAYLQNFSKMDYADNPPAISFTGKFQSTIALRPYNYSSAVNAVYLGDNNLYGRARITQYQQNYSGGYDSSVYETDNNTLWYYHTNGVGWFFVWGQLPSPLNYGYIRSNQFSAAEYGFPAATFTVQGVTCSKYYDQQPYLTWTKDSQYVSYYPYRADGWVLTDNPKVAGGQAVCDAIHNALITEMNAAGFEFVLDEKTAFDGISTLYNATAFTSENSFGSNGWSSYSTGSNYYSNSPENSFNNLMVRGLDFVDYLGKPDYVIYNLRMELTKNFVGQQTWHEPKFLGTMTWPLPIPFSQVYPTYDQDYEESEKTGTITIVGTMRVMGMLVRNIRGGKNKVVLKCDSTIYRNKFPSSLSIPPEISERVFYIDNGDGNFVAQTGLTDTGMPIKTLPLSFSLTNQFPFFPIDKTLRIEFATPVRHTWRKVTMTKERTAATTYGQYQNIYGLSSEQVSSDYKTVTSDFSGIIDCAYNSGGFWESQPLSSNGIAFKVRVYADARYPAIRIYGAPNYGLQIPIAKYSQLTTTTANGSTLLRIAANGAELPANVTAPIGEANGIKDLAGYLIGYQYPFIYTDFSYISGGNSRNSAQYKLCVNNGLELAIVDPNLNELKHFSQQQWNTDLKLIANNTSHIVNGVIEYINYRDYYTGFYYEQANSQGYYPNNLATPWASKPNVIMMTKNGYGAVYDVQGINFPAGYQFSAANGTNPDINNNGVTLTKSVWYMTGAVVLNGGFDYNTGTDYILVAGYAYASVPGQSPPNPVLSFRTAYMNFKTSTTVDTAGPRLLSNSWYPWWMTGYDGKTALPACNAPVSLSYIKKISFV